MKITLFVPTLNEIEGVKAIMPRVMPEWVDEIVIVDGRSKDGTKEWLENNGYKVITQTRPGGIAAWWEGFQAATGDVIIPFSPEGNSVPEVIPQLVAKIREGYDMVIASRYTGGAKSEDDDALSRLGNRFFNALINFVFGAHYTDSLVMYRAFKKDLLSRLKFNERTGLTFNFSNAKPSMFEILMCIRAAKCKLKVAEIPGDEPPRIGSGGSRAHPGPMKFYSAFLMLYHIGREFLAWSFESKLAKRDCE